MNSIYNKNNFKLAKPTTNKGSFYSMVTNFSEEFITDFLFLHNFNDENLAVLSNDENILISLKNSVICEDNMSIKRQDYRTNIEYHQNLVAGWFHKNLFIDNFNILDSEIQIKLSGDGSDRIINKKVSNKLDFKVIYKNKFILVELVCDHTNLVQKEEEIHFRNKKRKHLFECNAFTFVWNTELNSISILTPTDLLNFKDTYKWDKPAESAPIKKDSINFYCLPNYLKNIIDKYGVPLY